MKNILFIASYFPPAGGVGVMRITKFCKYLARDGYGITVLTPAPWSVKRLHDPSMQKDVPPQAKIINPGFIDYRRLIPGEVAKYIRKWERRHLFPDNMNQWVMKIIPQLPEIISKHKIDLAFISLPHFSLLTFAPVIKALGVPVVLDMRDPYTFNPYIEKVTDKLFQSNTRNLEICSFDAASKILNVSEQRTEQYQAIYPEWKDRFCCIPSGYDDDDFPPMIPNVNELPNTMFTLCYAGSYSSIASIYPYRDALIKLKEKHGINACLRLITPNPARQVKRDFWTLEKLGMFEYRGFMHHHEAIGQLLQSHAILFSLPVAEQGVYPGKVFEMIRTSRPILCAHYAEKDVHSLIRKANVGVFSDLNKPEHLENTIFQLYEQWKQHKLELKPNWEYINSFSYENRTKLLKQVLESV